MSPKEEDNVTAESGAADVHDDADPRNNNDDSRSLNRYNVLNLLAFVANAVITYGFGSMGWANRPTNGELSDKYDTIITPIGWAFSIWGPIFILEFIWVLWQIVLPSQRNNECVFAVAYNYVGVSLAQVGWTLAFSYEIIWLSLVFMLSILGFLFRINWNLQRVEKKWKGYFLWQFGLSLHYGWIIAASVVNTNLLLVAYGASNTAQLGLASAFLLVLLGVAAALLSPYPVDFTPPLVLVWALGGVYAKLQNPSSSIAGRFTSTQITGFQNGCIACAAIVLACVVVKILYVCFVSRRKAAGQDNSTGVADDEEAQRK